MFKGVNWIGWAAAVVASQIIGIAWYGMIFREAWLRAMGLTAEPASDNTVMIIGAVVSAVAMLGLAVAVARTGRESWTGGAVLGLFLAVFFAMTTTALGYVYGGVSWALAPIDWGYLALLYAAGGALIGGLKVKLGAKAAAA